jgi:hypothetical protein
MIMSVHRKINEARIALQGEKLNKSGYNKFAGYTYFELGDFLPTVNRIFNNIGLCGVISFGEELATLTITDVDDNSFVTITSPMKEANLKGCHAIQNLGAVETYTRRYLWVTALEIVEHDVLDATTGNDKKASPFITVDLPASPYDPLDEESIKFIEELAAEITALHKDGLMEEAFNKTVNLLNQEKLHLSSLLDSKVRSALKAHKESLTQLEKKAA